MPGEVLLCFLNLVRRHSEPYLCLVVSWRKQQTVTTNAVHIYYRATKKFGHNGWGALSVLHRASPTHQNNFLHTNTHMHAWTHTCMHGQTHIYRYFMHTYTTHAVCSFPLIPVHHHICTHIFTHIHRVTRAPAPDFWLLKALMQPQAEASVLTQPLVFSFFGFL